MIYSFSPLRFSLILFGLSVAAAVLAGVVEHFAGLPPSGGLLSGIALLIATALEARRYARSLSAPPQPADSRALALRCALTGALTFLAIMVAGMLLLHGPGALTLYGMWGQALLMVLAAGLCALIAGYFIIHAIARSVWKDRQ